jgi:hypothetical protein
MDFDFDAVFPTPNHPSDDEAAARWRGYLFEKTPRCCGPVETRPKSVTFPICAFCSRVIWNWPHYEEAIDLEHLCDDCAREEIEAQQRDAERDW